MARNAPELAAQYFSEVATTCGAPLIDPSVLVRVIPELVAPEECGWVVPAGSVDALVDAMRELLHSPPATLAAMGAEGRKRVLAQHDARTAVEPLIAGFRGEAG